MKEILLFMTGNKYFGLELPMVRSIHRPSSVMMKYGNQETSYLSDNGDNIPLCDFSMVIGEKTSPELVETKKLMFITVKNRTMALMVDKIERVVPAQSVHIEALPPVFRGKAAEWFPKVFWYDDRPVLLLNPEGMGYFEQPPIPPEVEQMFSHIVREDNLADMMMKSLDQALKASAMRGVERIQHILEGHGSKIKGKVSRT